jgi:hypothetical protein
MTAPAANRIRLEPHPAHGAAGADADLHAIRAGEPEAAAAAAFAHAMAAKRDLLTWLPTPHQGEDTP